MSDTHDYIPNTFQTPNKIIDELMPLLTDSEFRVLSFMVRHILGWGDSAKTNRAHISLSKFLGKKGYGSGCGLGRGTIIDALERLTEYRIVEKIGNPGKKGQLWELRLLTKGDPDIEGLHKRHNEKRAKSRSQTDNARIAIEAKRSVEQTSEESVGQTQGNPLFKPTSTKEKDSTSGVADVPPAKPSNKMTNVLEEGVTLKSDELDFYVAPTPTPKKERPANPWYDAIAETMGAQGFKNGRIQNVLLAKGKDAYAKYNLDEPLTDPEQVRVFWTWYQKECPGCDLSSVETVQDYVMRWQKEKATTPARPRPLEPMEPPPPDPVYPGDGIIPVYVRGEE
jgi:hypothetical protein